MPSNRPQLTLAQILAWAEAHLRRTGERPTGHSGAVAEAPGENWGAIDSALTQGYRGLPAGVSLVELLNRHWGERPRSDKLPLTIEQIVAWAEAHHQRTGKWPTTSSGVVQDVPEETWKQITWKQINDALWDGFRGLPGGDSLSRLLRRHRGGRAETST